MIPHVVEDFRDMIGAVDGVLLARDDAENHEYFSTPFLNAGMPIYIDKPLALTAEGAASLIGRQRYPGQIFSCSALKYARELTLEPGEREALGELRCILGTTPKSWDKYAIHIIDPMLGLIGRPIIIDWHQTVRCGDVVTVHLGVGRGPVLHISALGETKVPISLRVVGEKGWKDLVFSDSFSAFKSALQNFIEGILHDEARMDIARTMDAVRIIELGRLP
jgi:hypothetical protein